MTTSILALILATGCDPGAVTDPGTDGPPTVVDREESPPGRPGSQIGGIDCDYDKLEVTVVDEAGELLQSEVVADFPNGDRLVMACPASGCQLELAGAGEYPLTVSAPGHDTRSVTAVLDEDDVVGRHPVECGGGLVHEDAITITLAASDEGGDILTSHLTLETFDSSDQPARGAATIDGPYFPPYVCDCSTLPSCYIDIDGPGTYRIGYAADGGETGRVNVVIDARHVTGVNELGDVVYERVVRIDLAP